MAGVVEKIDLPEAIAVASGRRIYAYLESSGRMECIANRPGQVRTLEIYRDRLIDGGNYHGIKDTLAGKTLTGGFQRWNNLTTCHGRLFGSVDPRISSLHGIWELKEKNVALYRERPGPTRILACDGVLLDSGDYSWTGLWARDNPKEWSRILHSTWDDEIIFALPSYQSSISAVLSWDERYRLVAADSDLWLSPRDPLSDIVLGPTRLDGCFITCMDNMDDGTLIVGDKSGMLERINTYADPPNRELLRRFHEAVTAVKTLPWKVYDDGIRQKAVEQFQRRALYVKHPIFKQVSLSRVA